MKWFYVFCIGLFTIHAYCDPTLMITNDIESAIDDSNSVSINDMQLYDSIEYNQNKHPIKIEDNNTETEKGLQKNINAEKTSPFDIDRFLKELDSFDCDKKKAGTAHIGEAEIEYDTLCAKQIEESTFKVLGAFDSDPDEFYNHLSNNIYKPLAYDIEKKNNLSDVLKDLLFIDKQNSLMSKYHNDSSYSDFESEILNKFMKIEEMTNDMDTNHTSISDIMIQLLKQFHIYWNRLRSKGQIDKAKVDTKEIVRNILQQYKTKEKSLYEVTQTLASQIKEAYKRFLTAHQSAKLFNLDGPNIIAKHILNRYSSVLVVLRSSNYTSIKIVKEISLIIELQEAYYVANHKIKFNMSQNIHRFNINIYNKIEPLYLKFIEKIPKNDKRRYIIKHFTATLMLKLKQMQHIVFKYHGITFFSNFNRNIIPTLSNTAVKVYYDLLNNLILVPKTCMNASILRQCAFNEVNRIIRKIGSTYLLKRSTGGWSIYSYAHDMIKMIFEKNDNIDFSNWSLFRSYYFNNLFAVMHNIKERFMINDLTIIEDLEDAVGKTIEKFKKDNFNQHINFKLIDVFDNFMCKTMLDIKSNYNNHKNIDKDPNLLMEIQDILYAESKNFERKYSTEISQDFIDLVNHIRNTIEEWRTAAHNIKEIDAHVIPLPTYKNKYSSKPSKEFNIDDDSEKEITGYRNIDNLNIINQKNQELALSTKSNQSLMRNLNNEKMGHEKKLNINNEAPKLFHKNYDIIIDQNSQIPDKRINDKDNSYKTKLVENTSFNNLNLPNPRKLNDEYDGNKYNSDKTSENGSNLVTYDDVSLNNTINKMEKNEAKQDPTKNEIIEKPKDRYPIIPQHTIYYDELSETKETSLESGFTGFDLNPM